MSGHVCFKCNKRINIGPEQLMRVSTSEGEAHFHCYYQPSELVKGMSIIPQWAIDKLPKEERQWFKSLDAD